LSAAAIAGLAALLGLVLGRFWDSRVERKRWHRDQRVQSYQGVATEFYRLREAMRRVSRVGPDSELFSSLVDQCRDVGTAWNRELIAVWLHGSEPVVREARNLDDAANELFALVRERQLSSTEWRAEREPAQRCLEAFANAVRRDLSLAPLPIRRHWRPPGIPAHSNEGLRGDGVDGSPHDDAE
jgi:hypothetical protein